MNDRRWSKCAILGLLGLGLVACEGVDGRPGGGSYGGPGLTGLTGQGDDGDTEGQDEDGDGTDGDTDEDDDGGNGAPKFDLPADQPPPGETMGEEECAAVTEAAELVPVPADIIFVVDNSGSMGFEAGQIQAKLNDFSNQIIASGIDANVVLVSSYPSNGNGICIDPPLGSGGCPGSDSNPPSFLHVNQYISSHGAWSSLISTHNQWRDVMREDSIKHLVIVTDDTSSMNKDNFDSTFQGLDPSYVDYVHHSVVCHSYCPSAAGIGSNYINLSNETGGVAADLCDQDFQSVFDALSTEVIGGAALSCEFDIPAPPDGMEFDADQVNLEFDDGMGGLVEFGRVDSPAGCGAVADGWYYDNPAAPTMIVMCPQTCDMMQESENGAINIKFGCATVPAG